MAHWLTDTSARKSAVLQVMPLEESHTGEYMAGKYLELLDEWEIKHDRCTWCFKIMLQTWLRQ